MPSLQRMRSVEEAVTEAYLEMAPADCEQRSGRKCDRPDCEEFVFDRPHMHITLLEPKKYPYGVCSEECATALIAMNELTIVPKPVAP